MAKITKIAVYAKNENQELGWQQRDIGAKAENISLQATTYANNVQEALSHINNSLGGLTNNTTAQNIVYSQNGTLKDDNTITNKLNNSIANVSLTTEGTNIKLAVTDNIGNITTSTMAIDPTNVLPTVSTAQAGIAPQMATTAANNWQLLHGSIAGEPSWKKSDELIVTASYAGLVPKLNNSTVRYLRADGKWEVPANTQRPVENVLTSNSEKSLATEKTTNGYQDIP